MISRSRKKHTFDYSCRSIIHIHEVIQRDGKKSNNIFMTFLTIVATVIAAIIVSVSTMIFSQISKHNDLINTLEDIYIGCSKEWIDSHLGPPTFLYLADSNEISDYIRDRCREEEYDVNYNLIVGIYVTDVAILQAYFDKSAMSCRLFMIIRTDSRRWNQVNLPKQYRYCVNNKPLGKFSYYEIDGQPEHIHSYYTNGTGRTFYMEQYYYASGGNYYNFYFGTLDYGNFETVGQFWDNLTQSTTVSDDDAEYVTIVDSVLGAEFILENRKACCPNVYAISSPSLSYAEAMLLLSDYTAFDSLQLKNKVK